MSLSLSSNTWHGYTDFTAAFYLKILPNYHTNGVIYSVVLVG